MLAHDTLPRRERAASHVWLAFVRRAPQFNNPARDPLRSLETVNGLNKGLVGCLGRKGC